MTIHDAVPWTHPETLTPHGVRWHRAMARRAERFADAIIVDTHAVARELSAHFEFGDRVRVIGAAVGSDLGLPDDEESRAAALELPERYLLAVGSLEPRKALDPLIRSLAGTLTRSPLSHSYRTGQVIASVREAWAGLSESSNSGQEPQPATWPTTLLYN